MNSDEYIVYNVIDTYHIIINNNIYMYYFFIYIYYHRILVEGIQNINGIHTIHISYNIYSYISIYILIYV